MTSKSDVSNGEILTCNLLPIAFLKSYERDIYYEISCAQVDSGLEVFVVMQTTNLQDKLAVAQKEMVRSSWPFFIRKVR